MKTIAVWLTHKLVSCWNFEDRHRRRLEKAMPGTDIRLCRSKDELLSSLPEADTVITWVFKEEWFDRAPRLKKIITPAAGRDFLQVEAPEGVSISYSSFHGRIISETVLAMILSHARGIQKSCSLQQTKNWPRAELSPVLRLVKGSRITLLGFGHIGRSIGRLAKSFGARLYGIKRRPVPAPDFFTAGDSIMPLNKLDSILPESDHLVLCLPNTADTTNILNRERLELLPVHAGIYNVGRGNSIDSAALLGFLRSRPLSSAYLDVFQEEPLPENSPLRSCPNCLIMPHASAIAPEFMDFFIDDFLARYTE
jgi:D-2-hydroxyacid dehydrogenase (NADP+)